MKSHQHLETQLRAEARNQRGGPSLHLRTRVMAEVRDLHALRHASRGSRWMGLVAGTAAIGCMVVIGLVRFMNPAAGPAPGLAQVGGWHEVRQHAVTVSNELNAVAMDPFATELDALAADAEAASRFLAECVPL